MSTIRGHEQLSSKDSPYSPGKSPRKLDRRAVARYENLLLPTNTDLFHGYKFLLSGRDVNEEEKVYITNDIISQIKASVGEVLQDFF